MISHLSVCLAIFLFSQSLFAYHDDEVRYQDANGETRYLLKKYEDGAYSCAYELFRCEESINCEELVAWGSTRPGSCHPLLWICKKLPGHPNLTNQNFNPIRDCFDLI